MMLTDAIDTYIGLKRSLGAVFSAETRILRAFARALGPVPLDMIDQETTRAFCRGTGPPTRWWERKHQALHGFFAYLQTRGCITASPLPAQGPRIPRSFTPHIFSHGELRRLLDATASITGGRSPLEHATLRTLLLVLYGAGLRPSEGLRLRCCDMNLDERVLTIWNTKFYKSRLVPIGTALAAALSVHQMTRRHRPMPAGVRSTVFTLRTGDPIKLASLEAAFVRLRAYAQIQSPSGSRWQPRLHDLRHTFAVHRLIAWYREGEDVQACLPLLSTYLGHVNLSGTQTYLTMTSEVLAEASKRFEHYTTRGTPET